MERSCSYRSCEGGEASPAALTSFHSGLLVRSRSSVRSQLDSQSLPGISTPSPAQKVTTRVLGAALCFALLVAAALVVAAGALPEVDRDLIGWSEGDLDLITHHHYDPLHEDEVNEHELELIHIKQHTALDGGSEATAAPGDRPRGPKILSWDPRIFLYQRLLTDEECDHIITQATPRLSRSGVVEVEKAGGEGISDIRTSDGMFFERGEDPVITAVEQRLSEWSMIPVGHGEGIQVLRYKDGQQYREHFDYFFHEGGIDNGGNRMATVLMYLADVEEGGETVFPNVDPPPEQTAEAGYSECAMKGLAVRPRKGDAVIFFSLRTEGTLDKGSLHGGCPVIKGTKYAATKWFHVAHYAMAGEIAKAVKHVMHVPPPPPVPPGCVDKLTACNGWAEGGECDSNPHFMVGDEESPGSCLLSCGRCDLMPAPLKGNRRASGLGAV